MDATVYKYRIPVEDTFMLDLPKGAEILSVQVQGSDPFVWAKVDPRAPSEERRFAVRGTGHDATGVGAYIGTFQLSGGAFVGHLFAA